ncbi:hypothetical protein V5O48_004189 [Marasmius crinis-equi]|uniref:Uncharacterized protein n=1 Tax=Marasmius crinis-equi TaxID=585013 RepID=A0ABR3FR02_9AGAR
MAAKSIFRLPILQIHRQSTRIQIGDSTTILSALPDQGQGQGQGQSQGRVRDNDRRATSRWNRREKRARSGLPIKGVAQHRINPARDNATRTDYTIPQREVWTGPNALENDYRDGPITKDEALAIPGMELVKWDGIKTEYIHVGEDDDDVSLVALVALPPSAAFEEHKKNFDAEVEAMYEEMDTPDSPEVYRRGNYFSERSGISFGGGQSMPVELP